MNPLEEAVDKSLKLRPRTKKLYLRSVHQYVGFAGAGVSQWSSASVIDWVVDLRRRLTPASANTMLRGLRGASRRAFALGLIGRDFAAVVEAVPVVKEKTRQPVSLAVGHKILASCVGPSLRHKRDHAIVSLGFYHGLRVESIVGIQVEDINFSKGSVMVTIKGGRRHQVPLDPRSRPVLQEWLAALRREGFVSGAVFRAISAWNKLGDRSISKTSLYNIVRKRAAKAGVPNFYPHLMRHSFISWAVANGMPYEQIMLVTGHTNLAMILWYAGDAREAGAEPKKLIPTID
jgi:integrase